MARTSLESLLAPGMPAPTLAALKETLARVDSSHLSGVVEEHALLLFALLHRAASFSTSRNLPQSALEACEALGHAPALHYVKLLATLLCPTDGDASPWLKVSALRQAGDQLLHMVREGLLLDFPQPGPVERTVLRLMELPALHSPDPRPTTWGRWLLKAGGGSHWWHPDLADLLQALESPGRQPGPVGRSAAMILAVAESSQAEVGTGAETELLRQWEQVRGMAEGRRHG